MLSMRCGPSDHSMLFELIPLMFSGGLSAISSILVTEVLMLVLNIGMQFVIAVVRDGAKFVMSEPVESIAYAHAMLRDCLFQRAKLICEDGH